MVLPFANIGGDPEQEYFVDGVTEALTTDLSRMTGAFVIGRNTAFTFKGKAVDLRQIGRELNVRYVLEGSVQRSASRMRVNVQLIDAQTANHLWADRFDKPVRTFSTCMMRLSPGSPMRSTRSSIIAEARRAELAPSSDFNGPLFSRNERVEQRAQPRQSLRGPEAFRARAGARSRQRRCDGRRRAWRASQFVGIHTERRPRRSSGGGRSPRGQSAVDRAEKGVRTSMSWRRYIYTNRAAQGISESSERLRSIGISPPPTRISDWPRILLAVAKRLRVTSRMRCGLALAIRLVYLWRTFNGVGEGLSCQG